MNKSILLTLVLVLIFNYVSSVAHLKSKTQNNFAALRSSQTNCPLKQSGSEKWDFFLEGTVFTDETGYRTLGYHIDFEEPFCTSTTNVVVVAGLSGFDLDQSKDLILYIAAENVTISGFDAKLITNTTAIVNGVQLNYNAYQIPDSAN